MPVLSERGPRWPYGKATHIATISFVESNSAYTEPVARDREPGLITVCRSANLLSEHVSNHCTIKKTNPPNRRQFMPYSARISVAYHTARVAACY